MNLSLVMLASIEWASLVAAAWLAYRASILDPTQAKKSRIFALAAGATVALVLIPSVYAVWTVIGEYPMNTCPNCSPMTKGAIWTTLFFTVLLLMVPIGLVIYLLNLKKAYPANDQNQ